MTVHNQCDEQLLTFYHYQELPVEEHRKLESHLLVCSACQKTLAEIEASLARLPSTELQLSAAEKNRFTGQVLNRTGSSRWLRKPIWGGVLAASGALLLALFIIPAAEKPAEISNPALAELEVLEQLELLQNIDILEDLELLETLEDLG